MKWCCNRYTTGITIGSLYILGSVLYLIYEIVFYLQCEDNVTDPERRKDMQSDSIQSMIICGLLILVSSLFITAIVKRSHYLIIPWLLFSFYVFYVTLRTLYWWFIGAGMGGAAIPVFLILLLILIGLMALEICIFCFSCSLFKEIRLENVEKFEMVNRNFI